MPQTTAARTGLPKSASGLFLVQFSGPLLPAWREELRTQGMEMLRYIPEDAFVARCRGTDLERVQQLPFVRWVGLYRLEHKVQRALQDAGGPALPRPKVSVLFSPDITPQQLADAKALLESTEQEARLRFGAVLRGRVAPGQWSKLIESDTVLWVEPAPVMRLNDESSAKIIGGSGSVRGTYTQELGFDGRGVGVAVADSGLYSGDPDTMHPDLLGRVTRFIPYGNLGDATDWHGHGTHVAGIIAGGGVIETLDGDGNRFGLGVAPGATLVVQRIFDTMGDYVPPTSFAQLIGDAWEAGARIGSSSWGEDTHGRYDIAAAEFDELVRDASKTESGDQGYLLIFSAGNAGPAPGTIGSPAVAKNIIAVGASQSDRSDYSTYREGREAMADFSSRGPSEDGRVKPDLVAPGTWIASLRSPFGNDRYAWEPIDGDFIFMGGTSQAAPHITGAAAVFCQYYRQTYGSFPSPALIKAALIHSAHNLDDVFGTGPAPNMAEGWGRPDLTEIIGSTRAHVFVDQGVALSTGQTFETNLVVVSGDEELKVTMTYTDAPGFPAALPALVNDLDLEVIGPDGRAFRGNQLQNGVSVPDASTTDSINNVEIVAVPNPGPGEYKVRVRARNVVEDVCPADGVNQDFSLVICGNIPSPNSAVVLLDRAFYTAPSEIQIRLLDPALGAQSTQVKAYSTTEPLGQIILLAQAQGPGIYTGSVVTARAPAANDGQLHLTDGDSIRVEYADQVQHRTVSATATAHLLPPNPLDVAVSAQFGHTVVTWQTLDPSTSMVRYGTSRDNLSFVVWDDTLTTSHALELTNIVPGLTYYFEVISVDVAGNVATNDNGGALFEHPAGSTRTLLLVDDYQFTPGDLFIPLSTYTDTLELCEMTYDVWDPTANGAYPTYKDLRAYQIVIWRVNDSVNAAANSIARPEQDAIAQYVQSGGSFLMASMQILSRLRSQGDAGFVRDVLHVDRFLPNPDPSQHCLDCDEDFQVENAQGVANDWIGDGLQIGLDYQAYPLGDFGLGPDFADTFGPTTNATAFLTEPIAGKTCGLRFPRTGEDSPGRIVFLSFPLDAVPESAQAPNNSRSDVLLRMLRFLIPGLGGQGTIAFHHQRYRLPDVVTLEVADSDLAGQGSLLVNVSSTTVPAPVATTLRETARAGLFRGSVSLISATNLNALNQLRALDGDILQAQYEDVSGPQSVITHALVDTIPPEIKSSKVTADFTEATIEWETDEPADALVQFGESAFLGRTAYSPVLDTQHRLTFSGLVPDRGYFFKITSRDAAGNVTNADNGGRLFNFDTKTPLAPYLDDMESGTNGWKVVTAAGSASGWQWTAPNNGLVSTAHSPDHAWATNPLGDPISQIDSALRSPAIELAGGNIATLHFWHAYDFRRQTPFDVSDTGQLLLLTNALSPPLLLAEYTGLSDPWQEEVFDLTPHMGRTVFLIWHHQLVSFAATYRPGWALDDFEIRVETRPPGIIQISNNLAQARVNLDGPSPRIAQGTFTSFANMAPGRYVVTWSPVPFYVTPAPQTNNLVSNGFLKLTGTYTFPDLNNNQMSDLWETAFFGAAAPGHMGATDSDQDGFTDYAEFLAGTDPTQPGSYLKLNTPAAPLTTLRLQVQWPSVPGHAYRLESSTNLINWAPLGDWTQAVSSTTSRSVPITPSSRAFFRVGVRP